MDQTHAVAVTVTPAIPEFSVQEVSSQALYLEEAWHSRRGRAIREMVFGGNDGLVTTLGFLMGIYGALAERRIILIAGLAEAVAGALSMAVGAYLSTKAAREFYEREMQRELREMREQPEVEREEVRRIYRAKGFEGTALETVVDRITANPRVWLQCMMTEELGLIAEPAAAPAGAALVMGIAFMIGAAIPLVPYAVLTGPSALIGSIGCSVIALFALGASKTSLTKTTWWSGGLEVLLLGLLACLIGYGVGRSVGALH